MGHNVTYTIAQVINTHAKLRTFKYTQPCVLNMCYKQSMFPSMIYSSSTYCKTLTDIKRSVITRHDKYDLQQY